MDIRSGELHWNFYEDAGDMVDFHRFVLFVNHEFNDWISFESSSRDFSSTPRTTGTISPSSVAVAIGTAGALAFTRDLEFLLGLEYAPAAITQHYLGPAAGNLLVIKIAKIFQTLQAALYQFARKALALQFFAHLRAAVRPAGQHRVSRSQHCSFICFLRLCPHQIGFRPA